MEIYKDVKGYEGLYQVSNLGNVKSLHGKGKIMRLGKMKKGYLLVELSKNAVRKGVLVHRLVALAFIPNPENKPQINHKDGVKSNNNLSNLEWVTAIENSRHSITSGLQKKEKGEKCNSAKLTERNVLEIRRLFSRDRLSKRQIAEMFNCSEMNIYYIVNRKIWNHI